MNERERSIHGSAHGMSGGGAQEERLRANLAAAYPPLEASEALRQRVAELAAQHEASEGQQSGPTQRRTRPWSPLRIGLGLAGATVLATIAVGLAPSWLARQVLRRAEAAVSQVRSAHIVHWGVAPDGKRTRAEEKWYQAGRWRFERTEPRCVQVFADGKLRSYEPDRGTGTVVRDEEGPYGENPSGFSLAAMGYDMAQWRRRQEIRLLGDTSVAGRPAHQVVIEAAAKSVWLSRLLLVVDAGTDLPIRLETQWERDGRWVTDGVTEYRFNEPVPAERFAPVFPKSARVIEVTRSRQEWERHLANGIGQVRLGDRTIVIADLQVNAEGDVFVLYTPENDPGDGQRDWSVDLADEFGTRYLARDPLRPSLRREDPRLPYGYSSLRGTAFQGDWWVPATPQRPWKPCRLTLTFRHSPTTPAQEGAAPEEGPAASASFTLHVERPATGLVPEYMVFMSERIDDVGVRWNEARARADYHRYERRDLAQALSLYREAIRAWEPYFRVTRRPSLPPKDWIDVGEVLAALGRKEEARLALARAERMAHEQDEQEAHGLRGFADASELLSWFAWSPGRKPPAFTAIDLTGQQRSLDQYRGQVLLIDLWTTASPTWRAGLPRLKALYDRYHEQGFAILGVNMDFDKEAVQQFVRDQNLAWPQLFDGQGWKGGIVRQFTGSNIPRTILLDRRGVVHHADLPVAALEQVVADLLAERP
jgi:peroxiredoxin/outer membrane lipoprotein-sorting protein